MRYTVPLYSLCVSFDKKRLPFYFLGSASGLDCHVLHWHALPVSASLGQISKNCGTSSGLSADLVLLIPSELGGWGFHLLQRFAETRSTVALGHETSGLEVLTRSRLVFWPSQLFAPTAHQQGKHERHGNGGE